MTTSSELHAPRPRRSAWLAVAGLAVGAAIGGVWARASQDEPGTATVTTVVRPTPDVIVAVRSLARLESTRFHVERVIDLRDQTSAFFGTMNLEDAILLVAAGEVIAGVDFERLRPEDVSVDWDRRAVRLALPPAEIFSSGLDGTRTYVHTRATDLLAEQSPTLETRARAEAERTLRRAALDGGILSRADRDAARTVEGFVRALGFTDVNISSRANERAVSAPAPDLPAPASNR